MCLLQFWKIWAAFEILDKLQMSEGIFHIFSVMSTLLFCFILPLPKDGRLFCPIFPLWPWCFAVCAFCNSSSVTAKHLIWQVCALWNVIWYQSSLTQIPHHMQGLTLSHLVSCLGILHFVEVLLITMLGMISRQWKLTEDELPVTQEDALIRETIKYHCLLLLFFPWLSLFLGLVSSSASVLKACWKTSRENMK